MKVCLTFQALHVKMFFFGLGTNNKGFVGLFPSELLEIDRYQLLSKSNLLISQEAFSQVKNKYVKERNQMRRQIGSTMTPFFFQTISTKCIHRKQIVT